MEQLLFERTTAFTWYGSPAKSRFFVCWIAGFLRVYSLNAIGVETRLQVPNSFLDGNLVTFETPTAISREQRVRLHFSYHGLTIRRRSGVSQLFLLLFVTDVPFSLASRSCAVYSGQSIVENFAHPTAKVMCRTVHSI